MQTHFVLHLQSLKQFTKLIILVLITWFSLSCAWATDRITDRAYWQDMSEQATFSQAQVQKFKPYSGILNLGYTSAANWIRLEVSPAQGMHADDKLVLRIRPVFLDEISLFDPLQSDRQARVVGDRTNFQDAEYKSLAHTFVIPAGDQPRHIWLRLKTTSTSLIMVEALSQNDMLKSDFNLLLLSCAGLSLIAVFLVLVFTHWLSVREQLYALFVARHSLYFVYIASFFGLHRFLLSGWVDAHHLDLFYSWMLMTAAAVSLWFERNFLYEYAPPRWAKWAINSLLVWSGVATLLLAAGHIQLALQINMLLSGLCFVILLVVSAIFLDDQKIQKDPFSTLLPKKMVVTYYLVLSSLILLTVLPYLGLIGAHEYTINGMVIYALSSGMVITWLMHIRARQISKAHAQSAQNLAIAEQQTAIEKLRRQEQSQLLTMLMHELKTPLSIIDLAQQGTTDQEAQSYVAANVAIIKNILDRCLSADRIADGKISVEWQSVHLQDFVFDILAEYAQEEQHIQLDWRNATTSVQTDYQCLHIMLKNLLDNAIRYGDPLSPVVIQVADKVNESGQPGVAITVNNKTGIAAWPDPEKIFQKYYRSTGAKSISGTGLGLFLVANLASTLGAACRYLPDDNEVRFELWLPT
jgi:signal transduction histidine kinase